nr:MAG TPA: Endodeoxyribonuclease RusA [Caudoviricetes sp.]
MRIEFTAPVVAVPKARPRFTRSGRTYTPAKTQAFEKQIALMARRAMADAGVSRVESGAVTVLAYFYYTPPQSWSKKRKLELIKKVVVPKTTKPDIDNLKKAVLDGMNGVVFADDALVSRISAEKAYSYAFGDSIKIIVYTIDD